MENKSITTNTTTTPIKIVPATTENDNNPIDLENEKKKKKKKKRPFSLLKAALLIVRGRSSPKSNTVQVEVSSKGMLNKLVGSMRPLHLQNNPSSPTSVQSLRPRSVEHIEDVLPPPSSPHGSASSSADGMSRYASANNLQELDKDGGSSRFASANNLQELDKGGGSRHASSSNLQELDDDGIDDRAGDEMIDVKAEQFIAQFYHQMRLQRSQ